MTLATDVPAEVEAVPAPRAGVVRRFLRDPLGIASVTVLAVLVLIAVLVPLLPLPDPNAVNLRESMKGPSPAHVLGTDTSGRDLLARLLWGTQVNLLGAAMAVAIAFAIGVTSGLIAGYYGGWFDSVASWVNNMNMALPGIVVILAVTAVTGPSVWVAMAVFGVLLAQGFYRIVRAAVQSVRNELYVDAARVSGLSDARILGRHILTVVRAPVIIQAARLASIAIAIQAGLEFLGVTDASQPSWGNMLNEGFRRIAINPALILWPSLAIGLATMALHCARRGGRSVGPRSRGGSTDPDGPCPHGLRPSQRQGPARGLRPQGRVRAGARGEGGRPRRHVPRRPGRGPRPRRGVRLRQDPDGVRDPRPSAGGRPRLGGVDPVRRA